MDSQRTLATLLLTVLAALTCDLCSAQGSCGSCDLRQCPTVTVDNCQGIIKKDDCGCCPVCKPYEEEDFYDDYDDEDTVMMFVNASHKEACSKITCTRLQVCTLNIQGIPMCRCPSSFFCRKRNRRDVCAEDGLTYRSRCFLRIKECQQNRRIRIKHRGPCLKDRPARPGQSPTRRINRKQHDRPSTNRGKAQRENALESRRGNDKRRPQNSPADRKKGDRRKAVINERKELRKAERKIQREMRKQEKKERRQERKEEKRSKSKKRKPRERKERRAARRPRSCPEQEQ